MSNMSFEPALGLFRRACGLSAPLALVCQDASSPAGAYTPLDYPRPFMVVGRLPTADLSLNHEQVGRRHVYLQAIEGRVYCVDLESRTKTHWKGQAGDQSRGWLDPGGSIQVGPYRIHRTDLQPDSGPNAVIADPFDPPTNEGSDPLHLPRPTLELPFRVDGRSATWAPEGLLALVGRSDRCQLVLSDNNISHYHAALIRTPLGLWIIDLVAREGVYVNEMRVRWAWLADGDQVRMGPFTTVLRYETPPEGISREDVPLVAGANPTAPAAGSLGVAAGSLDRDRKALAVRSGVRSTGLARLEPPVRAPGPALPAAIDGAEWEPVLPHATNPVAMWQQQMQMMQSFHNDMVMMFQMFVAMHREHLGSVRDELDRVQQLTRELTRLNARLGQLPGSAETRPPSDVDAQREGSRAVPRPGPPSPAGTPRPPRQTGTRTERKPNGNHDDKPRATGQSAPVARDSGKSPTPPPPPMSTAETYADLTRRITEIQNERQGYWRSILKAINK
jgi:pSer/pThr/pTyr-binding forkhead associated (FHA) protein